MTDDSTTQCLLFPEFLGKPLVARFDQHHGSSDGGAVLLKAIDLRLGLTQRLAACLRDRRERGRVSHEIEELLSQRVFAIACGYPDGNDAARLADDPVHKMLVGRDPIDGEALASQPTLSRFENAVGRKELFRMGEALADVVIERHQKRLRGRARYITIDLDPTEDPTHGEQQLSFFNGYYDSSCYLPVVGFLTFNHEPEQYLFTALLRPGNAPDKPHARFCVRLDAGFAAPEIFSFLDAQGDVDYVVAMPKNAVLLRRIKKLLRKARRLARESSQTAHLYGECRYAARSWGKKRRVIVKAEVVQHPGREPKENPRFVVTNLAQTPKWIYEHVYCERGDAENRIKELKLGLEIDRTSCSSFWANQLRVLLTAAAYLLMQELRLRAARTSCARAQVQTLRERLIKVGAHVVESVRRLHRPPPARFLPLPSGLARGGSQPRRRHGVIPQEQYAPHQLPETRRVSLRFPSDRPTRPADRDRRQAHTGRPAQPHHDYSPLSSPSRVFLLHVLGRVEDGRGSRRAGEWLFPPAFARRRCLNPSMTPSPIPAHRTGRADFRRLTAEPPGAPFEAAGPPVRRRSCGHRSGVCPAWAPCGDAGESGVRVRGRSYPQPASALARNDPGVLARNGPAAWQVQ